MLSDEILDSDGAYEFAWVGKKAAIIEANKPIRKTRRPCKEKIVNWDNTENLYIEGDNLEVLKLLQESYLGKIDVIYIDPPYNTGKGTMRGMEAPIVLSGMYPINWKEYSKVDDTNSGTFMYLVNTICN